MKAVQGNGAPELTADPQTGGCTSLAGSSPGAAGQGSSLSVESFDQSKHYDQVRAWWEAQNPGSSVPVQYLPKNGLIVLWQGKPAAAIWVYGSDSAVCWIAFPVASPMIRKRERALVLDTLIASAKALATHLGYKAAVMSLRNGVFERRVEANGFQATDRGVTHYFGVLRKGS